MTSSPLFAVLLTWLLCSLNALADSAPKLVYVIPLRDDVEQTMVYLTRRGVKEAIEKKADALVLHIHTNGGRVDCTEDILRAIERFPYPEQTYAFIDTKALSAGAFIAAGTRQIYMAPGSVIGAATPVMAAPGGSAEKLPESYEAKITSAIQAMIRSTAEKNGHNPKVFDAMVDRKDGLVIDGATIVAPGKILTLTNSEAEKAYGKPPRPLLSRGTVESLDALIERIGGTAVTVATLQPTGFEKVARFLTMIAPFLLTLGLVLGYLEFKTPGFGIFGIGAAICFVIFFFGHYVAGLSGMEWMLLFFLGVVLILVEVFLLPGLVLPTLLGALLIGVAILFSMIDRYPTDPILPSIEQLRYPIYNFCFSLALSGVGALLIAKFFPQRLVTGALVEATMRDGSSVKALTQVKVGDEGVAITLLRPSGTVRIGDRTLDVITEGRPIESGTKVRIVTVDGMRIVVSPVSTT